MVSVRARCVNGLRKQECMGINDSETFVETDVASTEYPHGSNVSSSKNISRVADVQKLYIRN